MWFGRTNAVCNQMVAQVNAAFVTNGLDPLYKRENLTNWLDDMSHKASLARPIACDGPAVAEGAGGAKTVLDRESMDIDATESNPSRQKCWTSRSETKLDKEYESTSGMKLWDEEEEMQRGVDFHLLPSLAVETREPVTPIDKVTREALMSKYNASLGPPSLPRKQKASLLLKYESTKFTTASPSGATRT